MMRRGSRPLVAAAAALAVGLTAAVAIAHEAHDKKEAPAPAAVSAGPANPANTPLPLDAGGPFDLIDQTGRPVSDQDFRGRYMLVFFGYANCPGICPSALKAMAEAVDDLGADGEKVAPILITVDPTHDTPENLAPVVAKLHPRLIGLTGTEAQLASAAAAYGVAAAPAGQSWNGIDMIDHGPFVYLMGPDGKLLTVFPPIIDGASMAAAIRRYLS